MQNNKKAQSFSSKSPIVVFFNSRQGSQLLVSNYNIADAFEFQWIFTVRV